MQTEFKVNKFYLSPLSGRVIKSSSKLFKDLKQQGFIVDKHKCLYDIKSAEHCLNKLLSLYPSLVYPPSNFINIPRTHKQSNIRSFVLNENKSQIIGVVDKHGSITKPNVPIDVPSGKQLPEVKDPLNALSDALQDAKLISLDETQAIKKIVKNDNTFIDPKKFNLIYNPVQRDFVPINGTVSKSKQLQILKTINDSLIPKVNLITTEDDAIIGYW
jgi:hypothetical protein